MRGNFDAALSLALADEGGFVDDPQDPGGATNKGITLATFRQFVNPHATVDDLKAISFQDVATVYRKHYWNAVSADDLPPGVDYAAFDYAVNSGPGRVGKSLQRIVGAPVDGAIGSNTLAAARTKPVITIITGLCEARLAFLKSLPTWPRFGNGWAARVARVEAAALKMAAGA